MTLRSMTLPLFALVAALAGCSAEAGTSAGAASTDEARSNVVADNAGGPKEGVRMRPMAHRPAGPDFLVRAALHAPIDLTAEQRATIEGLLKQSAPAKPRFDAARAQKLAAAIRNNSVADLEETKPDASAREARVAASAKALATLHDTLTAEQRAALVDSIEQRAAAHGPKHGAWARKHGAKRGHGERAENGKPAFRGRGLGAHGPMAMLAGLDLTEEQRAAIKAKLDAQRPAPPTAEQREAMKTRMESMRAEMKAKLESFKSDQFDATAFVTPPKDLARPEMVRHHKNPLAEITPILTPAQREILAARIEKGPVMRHPGKLKAMKPSAVQKVK